MGVGNAIRGCVRVLYPVRVRLVDDEIRVLIQLQERGDGVNPVLNVATIEKAAIAPDRTRNEDVAVRKLPREDDLAQEAIEADAALALEFGLHVLAGSERRKLGFLAIDDDVVVRLFSEI